MTINAGSNISKSVAYAVANPPKGVLTSKASAYIVLSTENHLNVSKTVAYAVLSTKRPKRMLKLIIPPDNSTYSATDGTSVVSVQLQGGAGRYRRDVLGATSTIEASWTVDRAGFVYLRSFFRGVTVSGAKPFEVDLIIDDCELTTHKAFFRPGTFKLASQRGLIYVVTASLEVETLPFNISDMTDIVNVYNEFGGDWQNDESIFNDLVNTEIPGDNL